MHFFKKVILLFFHCQPTYVSWVGSSFAVIPYVCLCVRMHKIIYAFDSEVIGSLMSKT